MPTDTRDANRQKKIRTQESAPSSSNIVPPVTMCRFVLLRQPYTIEERHSTINKTPSTIIDSVKKMLNYQRLLNSVLWSSPVCCSVKTPGTAGATPHGSAARHQQTAGTAGVLTAHRQQQQLEHQKLGGFLHSPDHHMHQQHHHHHCWQCCWCLCAECAALLLPGLLLLLLQQV